MKPNALPYLFINSVLFILLLPYAAQAAPLDNWVLRNSGVNNTLNAVTYGNGMFVVVGDGGTILTSPEGVNWTARSSGTTASLRGVTYGIGMFVVVGDTGTILTSPDGEFWTPRSAGTTASLGSIAFGNGVYLIAGEATLISHDGINWSIGDMLDYTGLTFGNGAFLAPSVGGYLISCDGINWDSKTVWNGMFPGEFRDIQFLGIASGNGPLVIVGGYASIGISPAPTFDMILTSSDGTNWIQTYSDSNAGGIYLITYGNGYFVALGSKSYIMSAAPDRILISRDGYNWAVAQLHIAESLNGLAFGNSTFIAVGSDGMILQAAALADALSVPTLSEWGMVLFMILAGGVSIYLLRRDAMIH